MSSKSPLLSIIIVSYNTAALTVQCIESVLTSLKNSELLHNTTELFLVDNASSDDTLTQLAPFFKKHSFMQLIKNKTNLGFAAANNQGISQAAGKYYLLLNSDTIVVNDALEKLVQTMEDHPIQESTANLSGPNQLDRLGLLSATLLNPDGTLQPQGGSLPTLWSLFTHMLMFDDLPLIGRYFPSTQHTGRRANTPQAATPAYPQLQDWVAATALLIRAQVLSQIGTLDENIFMYGEDVELCVRARHHHWDAAIDPQAKIIHLGSASSTSQNAIMGELKGWLYIWSKHFPLWQVPLARLAIRVGCMLRVILFGTITKQPERAAIYRQALQEIPLYDR